MADVINSHGQTFTASGNSAGAKLGVVIETKRACNLKSVVFKETYPDSELYPFTASKAYLYTGDYSSLLQTVNISSFTATFNYSLSNETEYCIVIDKEGDTFTMGDVEGEVYPISSTDLDYISSIVAGNRENVNIRGIDYIVTNDGAEPTTNTNNFFHFM